MDIRQLRPEQKKLWRRIYLHEKERGADATLACREADAVVAHWEARGAFSAPSDITATQPWAIVTASLREKFPEALEAARAALQSKHDELVRTVDAQRGTCGSVDVSEVAANMQTLAAKADAFMNQ